MVSGRERLTGVAVIFPSSTFSLTTRRVTLIQHRQVNSDMPASRRVVSRLMFIFVHRPASQALYTARVLVSLGAG